MLKDKITNKKKKKVFTDKINELENKLYDNKNYKKTVIEQLNALSYNKKNLINHTWDNYLKNLLVMNL
jgi:hypothetical protein